jgi:hypothetical protein
MGTRFNLMDFMMSGNSNIISTNGNNIPQINVKRSGERQKTFTTGVEDGSNEGNNVNRNEQFNPLKSNE